MCYLSLVTAESLSTKSTNATIIFAFAALNSYKYSISLVIAGWRAIQREPMPANDALREYATPEHPRRQCIPSTHHASRQHCATGTLSALVTGQPGLSLADASPQQCHPDDDTSAATAPKSSAA